MNDDNDLLSAEDLKNIAGLSVSDFVPVLDRHGFTDHGRVDYPSAPNISSHQFSKPLDSRAALYHYGVVDVFLVRGNAEISSTWITDQQLVHTLSDPASLDRYLTDIENISNFAPDREDGWLRRAVRAFYGKWNRVKESMDDELDVKELAGDRRYQSRKDWANAHLIRQTDYWLIPGTDYSPYKPYSTQHMNHVAFEKRYPGIVESEADESANKEPPWYVGLTAEALESMARFNQFRSDCNKASNGMVIDPFVEEELQASGIAQAWKTGLAHELAIKLALKFGDQFNTVDPVDDILRFLESPNGLAFFNKKAAQADTYWQDTWGKGEFDINVGNVVDFIQPDELKKLIYPGQERAQLKLSIPGEPSRENDQREMFEAEDELSDFIRQLRHNPEDVSRVLDEYLDYDEADQMWTLASYSDYTGGAVDRANANYFRNTYPGVVSRIFGTFNTQACGIKRKDLKNLDGTTLDQILGDLRSLENYPVLDEGYYAEAERDMQDEAWSSWIRRQFMRDMENKFPGYEAEFDSLNQEQERKFFEMIRDRTGIEWFESGSQMTVHVDQIVERATENMLDEFFHPELMEEAQAPKPLLLHYGVSSVEVAKCFETGLRKPFLRADAAQALQDARKTAEEIGGEPVVLDIIIRDLTRLRPDQYAMKTIQEGTTESWRVSLDLTGSVRYDGSLLPENLSVRPLLEAQFSCVMAPAPDDITQKVISWGQMFVTDDKLYIDPKKPDSFGREHEVHVTVKFGLHEKYPSEELLRIIEETQPFEIDIGRCSLFENEIFDVVKFDIQSEGIRALNARISELANSDEHPDYTPHMTVAYVKKGSCHDLIGKPLVDGENANGNRFIVKAVIFSPPNKDKRTLFLGKPNLQEAAVDKPVVNA